jgi:hypothetical protein
VDVLSRVCAPKPDIVIAADVFYDAQDFEAVVATVYYLDAPFYTVYQHRGGGARGVLSALLKTWGLTLETLAIDPDEYPCLDETPATLELLLIKRNLNH